MDNDFVDEIEKLLADAFLSITSAKMNEDFLASANKAFHEIPNFKDSFRVQETNANSTDPS